MIRKVVDASVSHLPMFKVRREKKAKERRGQKKELSM
jgi:hypothetical protein